MRMCQVVHPGLVSALERIAGGWWDFCHKVVTHSTIVSHPALTRAPPVPAEDLTGEGFINEGMVRSGDSQDLRSWQSCFAQGCACLICGGDPQQRHPRLDRVHARHHAGFSRSGPGRAADWRIASDLSD